MTLPYKDGIMIIKVPREPRRPFYFKKKDNKLMEDYIDAGIGNYAILDMRQFDDIKMKIITFWDNGGFHLMELVQVHGAEL